jgi:hypothetical protein
MSKHYICIDNRNEQPFAVKAQNYYQLRDILIAKNIELNSEWDEYSSEWVFCQFCGEYSSAKAANEYMSSEEFVSDLREQKAIREFLDAV